MNVYLGIDQYGNKNILENISYKELRKVYGAGRINKMYVDQKSGGSNHVGYVLGQGRGNISLWVTLYQLKRIDDL